MIWGQMIFFRYLQIRNYFNQNLKVNLNELQFVETFLLLTKSGAQSKIISKLYNSILRCKNDSTLYIKAKWEKEGICQLQRSVGLTHARYNGLPLDLMFGVNFAGKAL